MSLLLTDGQNQRLNGSIASLLSMMLGGFILLPYFALRQSSKARKFQMNWCARLFESKLVSVLLMLATLALVVFAFAFGDWDNYRKEFNGNRFIHVMTIDFCIVSLLFPFLVDDDLKRRQASSNEQSRLYMALCFLPLIGPLIYLFTRQPLK